MALAQTLSESREMNSCMTDSAITGMGTSIRIASATSQLTSPVSSTYGETPSGPAFFSVGLFQKIDEPRSNHRAVSPAAQDVRDVELVFVVVEQIEPLADRLQHPELDSVVDQLREVARAWWPAWT